MMNGISSHRIDSRTHRSQYSVNFDAEMDWKSSFLTRNPWMCEIPNDFITDSFNVYGLSAEFEEKTKSGAFQLCLDIITGKLKPELAQVDDIDRCLAIAYGMVHGRFLLTQDGLAKVEEKYRAALFGVCPRVHCRGEKLLPIGLSSEIGRSTVKVFCPCCREVYEPRARVELDGAFFGPNMVHIFADDLDVGEAKLVDRRRRYQKFCRRAFGFRVHTESCS